MVVDFNTWRILTESGLAHDRAAKLATRLEQVEALAKELNVSRSKVFAMALDEFLRKRQGEKLLEQINSVYAEVSSPDREEEEARRAKHRELVEGTW